MKINGKEFVWWLLIGSMFLIFALAFIVILATWLGGW